MKKKEITIMFTRCFRSNRCRAVLGASTLALAVWVPLSAQAQFLAPAEDATPAQELAAACGPGDNFNNVSIYPGSPGNDRVTGSLEGDQLEGGPCDDELSGDNGEDTIEGNAGDDTLLGDANADVVRGGPGDDVADGGIGNDVVLGGSGDDTCFGDSGEDVLFGGTGADKLDGGPQCDVCFGDELDTFRNCEVIVINGVLQPGGEFGDCADAADPEPFLAEEN